MASVAVDTWGVDYGFIDARGRLLANPVHYRDTRHDAMLEPAFSVVPRDELYAATGIQIMSINTVFQLLSEARADDPILAAADRLLMMPDLFSHFLCGSTVAEYTEASTSGCLDPWTRDWARPLFDRLGIPHALPARGRAARDDARRAASRGCRADRPARHARRRHGRA